MELQWGNTKPRPLWCGFGFVTNILQSLKTAFDDGPNFPFLSLIPVFLIALLCPTLKQMFPFPNAYTFQIFAPGFLSCPFCQLKANACTFRAVSSKVRFTTLSVVFASPSWFSFCMTILSIFQAAFPVILLWHKKQKFPSSSAMKRPGICIY